jgi:hypothetical protein
VSEPDLTPEEQQVRRLLADARHDEPMPDDVVDRLDRVLADLSPARPDPVRDHVAERRRRRLRNLVLAAAAVVVVGVGISRIDLPTGGDDADSGTSAFDSPEAASRDAGGDSALAGEPGPVVLHSGTFERQVRRYAAGRPLSTLSDERATQSAPGDSAACAGPGHGRRVAAVYDGEPAVLVVHPVRDGTRRVDLYLCGSGEPLRSTTVPAR